MRAVLRSAVAWGVMAWAMTAVAGAKQPAADMTGVYGKDGGELAILQGDNETLVYYEANFPQGQSVGTCECLLVLQQRQASDRWSLKSTDSEDTWILRVQPKKLVLEGGSPRCCGAGWPGTDSFDRGSVSPPRSCKVTAPRVYFHGSDAQNTRRKAYTVAGDTVQAYIPGFEPDFVPARFVGPKKTLAGLLMREQLECKAQDTGAAEASAAPVDVTPLAGTWVQVLREDGRYFIEKPCSADVPHFSIQPEGGMNVEYGQEGEELRVTGLKPGAAGAYTLELRRDSGSLETLEWTMVDAKKGIIRLKGGSGFFQDGALFVREDKKGGLTVRAEPCDEYEP